jgi:hypothetical protein
VVLSFTTSALKLRIRNNSYTNLETTGKGIAGICDENCIHLCRASRLPG